VRAGQTVACGPTRSGARCYLCVAGGIQVTMFLGSASTHVLSGLGGFEGRALRKGDVLAIGEGGAEHRLKACATLPRKTLRVTSGPQEEWFPQSARNAFYGNSYRVTEESNRMGLRLDGPAIECARTASMITEPVSLGAIQIPAGGQPIILFVEQQTTGGYPKIANVIAADLSSVGQLRPRDEVRFELVTPAVARRLICEQEEDLFRQL
jgi:5-oxoprolinase (ATP-hydrolysing) subunit C